jgi:competence protein ComEA
MSRTAWLGALALLTLLVGVAAQRAWPSSEPALTCEVSDVRRVDIGTAQVAVCGRHQGLRQLSAGPVLTLGGKLDLNRAAADDLVLVPGVGPSLARSLVQARIERGGFRSWEQVHQVKGVGPVKLESLQRWTYLSSPRPSHPSP